MDLAAKKAFTRNASNILERRFRRDTLKILLKWSHQAVDYDWAHSELLKTFSRRNRLIAKLIPSSGISQALMAYGFFSISTKTCVGGLSTFQVGLAANVSKYLLYLRNAKSIAWAVRRDILLSQRGVAANFSPITESFIANSPPDAGILSETSSEKTCLIVGPGDASDTSWSQGQDLTIILVTLGKNLWTLKSQLSNNDAMVALNLEVSEMVLTKGADSEWAEVLKLSTGLLCHLQVSKELSAMTGRPSYPLVGNIPNLWGGLGGPNLVPYVLDFLISKRYKATIVGANLYVASTIYPSETDPRIEEGLQPGSFHTCISQASHNAAMNFLVLKKLYAAGHITGDDRITNVLGMGLSEYLAALDVSLGSTRK